MRQVIDAHLLLDSICSFVMISWSLAQVFMTSVTSSAEMLPRVNPGLNSLGLNSQVKNLNGKIMRFWAVAGLNIFARFSVP